jgi:hypothetical protein
MHSTSDDGRQTRRACIQSDDRCTSESIYFYDGAEPAECVVSWCVRRPGQAGRTLVAAAGAARPERGGLAAEARAVVVRAAVRAGPLRARDLGERALERAVAGGEERSGRASVLESTESAYVPCARFSG